MNLLHNIKTYGIFFTLMMSGNLIAQDNVTAKFPVQLTIPPKASINLAGSEPDLSLINGKSTQQVLTPTSSSKTWINYSSVVERNSTNTICASLGSGNLPAEVLVKLRISEDAGAGSGNMGKPADPIVLSNYPQAIITDIGSCYTGQGVDKGHLLTYTWEYAPNYDPKDFNVEELSIEVSVIYTIVNNE